MHARVRDGVLVDPADERGCAIAVGSDAWARWLELPTTSSFRFEQGDASFTARKQMQRDRPYWHAYRRRGGRLRKAYLGRAVDLTLARLEEAARRLDAERDATLDRRPATPVERHNLPHPVNAFIGREAEANEVRLLLERARLVTLTGAGGMGKTRLALRVAADLLDDGVDAAWLVELGSIADPALAPRAVTEAVGARETPGQPAIASLTTTLRAGRTLLVLDNCEHLTDACADLARRLLEACPDLRILATSREPLGAPGEIAWRVPPLALPPENDDATWTDIAESPAVRLFAERARAVRQEFALTEAAAPAAATICRRLDGIPLAIELAAARARLLSMEELAARLGDRFRLLTGGSRSGPIRHRTLRAAIDWSYDLLDSQAQRCFERLSVFVGGFTLERAEAVCAGADIEPAAMFDLLAGLVDRSLVLADPRDGTEPTRYRLLETLRAYGGERLAERGAVDRTRQRHARWLLAQAERANLAFHGPEQGRWLRWVAREHDNARAAFAWAVEREHTDLAVRLAAAFAWPCLVHQRWSDGFDWAQRALALPNSAPTRARGQLLLNGAIPLAIFNGDLISNRPSDAPGPVQRWIAECRAIGDLLGDDELRLGSRGFTLLLQEFGLYVADAPVESADDVLATARRIGHAWGTRRTLDAMALRALRQGDLAGAARLLREAIASARDDGDGWSLATELNALGDIERARGAHTRARPLYEESAAVFAAIGLSEQPSLEHNLGYVALAAGDRTEAAMRFRRSLAQFRRHGAARGMAESLIGLGAVAVAAHRAADAGWLFGAGEAALDALDAPIWPANRPDVERWLARARAARGDVRAEFERMRTEGRSVGLEQAATRAIDGGVDWAGAAPVSSAAALTPREREIARLAAEGLTNREIGAMLSISEKTVANHVQRALDKLDCRTRTHLAARAAELGLAATPAPNAGAVARG